MSGRDAVPPGWHVAVVVPARDEEDLLPAALEAVTAALAAAAPAVDRSIVVVAADACRDATGSIARRLLRGVGETVVVDAGDPGAARRAGVARALHRFGTVPPDRVWLANTDADGTVDGRWLADQLVLADRGAAAVAGIVEVDDFGQHPPGTADRFHAHYTIHQDGTHPHVHGANLGVRADAYLDAGGWRPAAVGEDHDLWNRLVAGGWPVVSSTTVRCATSGRAAGRATGGFATTLRALGEAAS